MELGNACFGNSRGPVEFPDRNLVNSKEWNDLLKALKLDTYCHSNNKVKSKNLIFSENGEVSYSKNNRVVFSIFPYYWGDCTCGADEANEALEEELRKKYFTDEEYKLYMEWEDICEDDCPAADLWEKSNEELVEICTCGIIKKNIELQKEKDTIKEKIEAFDSERRERKVEHSKDCLLVKYNFVYHPGREDEFWINWYKYPFRDSYMNKNYSEEKIKEIWRWCLEEIQS